MPMKLTISVVRLIKPKYHFTLGLNVASSSVSGLDLFMSLLLGHILGGSSMLPAIHAVRVFNSFRYGFTAGQSGLLGSMICSRL